MRRLTSRRNALVRQVRAWARRPAARREAQVLVLEGVRLAEEALRARARVLFAFATPTVGSRGRAVLDAWQQQGVEVYEVTLPVMDALRTTKTPPGLVAVVARPRRPWPAQPTFVLILDGVSDPGNVGTLLRTAWAAGVEAVALVGEHADPWAPKVLRAGMGAHFHLPVWEGSWDELAPRLAGVTVYVAAAQGDVPYFGADFRQPVALIIGSEAHGPGSEAYQRAQQRVYIPMPGGAESLNAAVAGGILMLEVVRQRANAAPP